jgi:hypothetical protein
MAGFFTIYVEGNGDVKFIRDYFEFLFQKKISVGNIGGIINVEGKDKFAKFENALLKTTQQNGINLIIFDADTPKNNGGFAVRPGEIITTLKGIEINVNAGIKSDIFLFPDNKSDGALEDLLERIINPANAQIFDCWTDYEGCLKKKDSSYTIPAKKSKIYSYLEVLYGETHQEKELVKDPNRNYLVEKHWKLDNKALIPLKDFLTKYCK